jgi:hypothetical protein
VAKRLHTAHQRLLQALATSGFTIAAGALSQALGATRPEAIPRDLSKRLKDLALRPPAKASLGGVSAATIGLLALIATGVPVAIRLGGGPTPPSESLSRPAESPRSSAARAGNGTPALLNPPERGLVGVPDSEALAHVRGSVRDRITRLPIVGAEVWLEPFSKEKTEDHPPRIREVKTGPDGLFALDVPPGKYLLDALAPGYVRFRAERVIESYTANPGAALREPSPTGGTGDQIRAAYKLDLSSGIETTSAIDLLSASEIRVQVVDGAGRPVPDVDVVLETMTVARTFTVGHTTSESIFETMFEPDGRTSRYRTDLQGRVTISNVYPEGTALLSASKIGFQTQNQGIRMNGPVVEATMALLSGVTLSGHVLSDRGEPIRGACVFLLRPSRIPKGDFRENLPQQPSLTPETHSPDQSEPLRTKADGEFRAADQSSAFRLLGAFAPGWAPRLIPYSGADAGPTDVALSPSGELVTGTVLDETGKVLEGVSVAVHRYQMAQGDSQLQLVFLDERGGGWTDHADKSLVAFLPQEFRPPQGTSLENGSFRLEGVALAQGVTTYLELQKEGYERLRVEVPSSGEVWARLRIKKGNN